MKENKGEKDKIERNMYRKRRKRYKRQIENNVQKKTLILDFGK